MIKIGITHGDINGIGYEVIMKALADERITEMCTPVIFGSAKLIGYYRKVLGMEPFSANQITDASQARDGVVNLVNISDKEFKVDMGQPTAESGAASFLSLQKAVAALKRAISTPWLRLLSASSASITMSSPWGTRNICRRSSAAKATAL